MRTGLRLSPRTGCWVWVKYRNDGGYGVIRVNSAQTRTTNRVAAFLWLGVPLDGDHYVCHRCDNPACCRPHKDHLYIGDNSSNQRDAYDRGQQPSRKGEHNGRAKLTQKEVNIIRKLHERGYTQKTIAHKFGVSNSAVSKIIRRKAWR